MNWAYTVLLIVAAVPAAVVAVIAWRRRSAPGATGLAAMMLAVIIWMLTYAVHWAETSPQARLFWLDATYLGVVTVPTLFFVFVMQFTGRSHRLTQRNRLLLAIEPIITFVLLWSDPLHGLFYGGQRATSTILSGGPWFWVNAVYSYGLTLVAMIVLGRAFVRAPRPYRAQTGAILLGALLPWIGNVISIAKLNPFPDIDPTPFAFTLTGVVFAFGLFRYRILDLAPIARDAILEGMSDGMIVLDAHNRIVDINSAAQQFTGLAATAIGQQAETAFAAWPELVARFRDATMTRAELFIERNTPRYLDMRISPLQDRRGRITGRLIALRDITERKRMEQALRESEERYRGIFEAAIDSLFVLDGETGAILDVNRAACDLYGYSRDELLTMRSVDVSAEPERTAAALKTGLLHAPIRYHRKKDGAVFPVDITASYFTRGDRALSAVAIRDISQRIRAEEAEREQRSLAEALRDTAAALNSTLNFEEVLDRVLFNVGHVLPHDAVNIVMVDSMSGLTRIARSQSSITGDKETFSLSSLQTSVADVPTLRQMAETGLPLAIPDVKEYAGWVDFPTSNWIRSYAGAPIRIKEQTLGFLSLNSSTPGFFTQAYADRLKAFADQAAVAIENAMLYDTVQRHAEELERRVAKRTADLEHERHRLQTILDAAGEGIVLADRDWLIQYINPAVERLNGYTLAEVVGRPVHFWRSDLAPQADLEGIQRQLANGATEMWHGEAVIRRKDGTPYDASLTVTSLRERTLSESALTESGGQIAGYVEILSDISRLKELERLKNQFVTRIGHEFRTPVTNVILAVELLERGKLDKREKYLNTLRQESIRIRRLVEGFLEMAELDTGAEPLSVTSTDLNKLAAGPVASRRDTAAERSLMLDYRPAPDLPETMTDPALFVRALSILLENAFNYTPRGGWVMVTTEARRQDNRDWVTLSVQDSGPGISIEEIPHLFERFYRGKAAEDYATPGVGLGLAICKAIVDKLGGRITVESQAGSGATFTVWLRPAGENAV